jgi:hypothetical protein
VTGSLHECPVVTLSGVSFVTTDRNKNVILINSKLIVLFNNNVVADDIEDGRLFVTSVVIIYRIKNGGKKYVQSL